MLSQLQFEMKKSMNSFDDSQCELYQIPQQWDYLSKRLGQVEKGLTKIQQKHHILEKQFNFHAHQVTKVQVDLSEQINSLKHTQSQLDQNCLKQMISNTMYELKRQVEETFLKKIERLQADTNLNLYEMKDNYDNKMKNIFDQTHVYIDKAVYQLKELLKKYVKDQNQIQIKMEKGKIFDSSPTLMPRYSATTKNSTNLLKTQTNSNQKIGKSLKNSQTKNNQNQNFNSSTSRVNYLRQKLKQFEKINKKYENSQNSQPEVMQKMKNYKQYLEQTQSELEPSNIYPSKAQFVDKFQRNNNDKKNHTHNY